MAGTDYFSIPIFFIIFRETTEAAVIVSVLLAFLNQVLLDDPQLKKRLARQVKTIQLVQTANKHGHRYTIKKTVLHLI